MKIYPNFSVAIYEIMQDMVTRAQRVERGTWQGVDVSQKPEMAAYELHYVDVNVRIGDDLARLRQHIRPNLPWADDHFAERVGGMPLNPGKEWANWPWGKSADRFRLDPHEIGDVGGEAIFNHTYMQRYWPKYAGWYPGGIVPEFRAHEQAQRGFANHGIYFTYGDLGDVVTELAQDPTTRQAILPIFFPEDTGYRSSAKLPGLGRKPCSIFYHWQWRHEGELDIVYYLRSCDLIRHFRDDIYLTVRLNLWMLEQLRLRVPSFWNKVKPGRLIMLIGNLHCFVNDWHQLGGKK